MMKIRLVFEENKEEIDHEIITLKYFLLNFIIKTWNFKIYN